MDFSPQDYAFSKLIAIDCDVWATDTQAPVVLIGNDFPIGAAADGADLRFSDAAATAAVPHWIQQFDAAGRTAIVWLRPAAIPAVGADSVRMHWGNSIAPSASSYDAVFEKLTSVDARLLLHFDEAAGVPVDSSGNHFAVSSVAGKSNASAALNFSPPLLVSLCASIAFS